MPSVADVVFSGARRHQIKTATTTYDRATTTTNRIQCFKAQIDTVVLVQQPTPRDVIQRFRCVLFSSASNSVIAQVCRSAPPVVKVCAQSSARHVLSIPHTTSSIVDVSHQSLIRRLRDTPPAARVAQFLSMARYRIPGPSTASLIATDDSGHTQQRVKTLLMGACTVVVTTWYSSISSSGRSFNDRSGNISFFTKSSLLGTRYQY